MLAALFSLSAVSFDMADAAPLDTVSNWAYQLQEIDLSTLASSPYDLLVIDYSSEGSADSEFSSSDIQALKDTGKIVVAYMSIGEAEDYRFYFKDRWVDDSNKGACGVSLSTRAPGWLDNPNPDFCGNYKTKFWKRRWQRIIFGNETRSSKSYLNRIVAAGFDGVYLDIIDGYEYWLQKPKSKRRSSAASDMANFVQAIAQHARETLGRTDFVVIPQNGSGILDQLGAAERPAYLNAIDGIGAEDTYYFGDEDENNELQVQEEARAALLQFVAAGKIVFAVDYLTEQSKIEDFSNRACADGFIPQVARRELADLETQQLLSCD